MTLKIIFLAVLFAINTGVAYCAADKYQSATAIVTVNKNSGVQASSVQASAVKPQSHAPEWDKCGLTETTELNLLKNPSFEDGIESGWSHWPGDMPARGNMKIVMDARDRKQALALTGNIDYPQGGNINLMLSQTVKVDPAAEYEAGFSFFPKKLEKMVNLKGEAKNIVMAVVEKDLEGKTVNINWLYPKMPALPYTQWIDVSKKLTMGTGTVEASVNLYFKYHDSGDIICFDRIFLNGAVLHPRKGKEIPPIAIGLKERLDRIPTDSSPYKPGPLANLRRLPRPLVICETQGKYGLFNNYFVDEKNWTDRPLFMDRATRYADDTHGIRSTAGSVKKQMAQITKLYKIDGLELLGPLVFNEFSAQVAAGANPEFRFCPGWAGEKDEFKMVEGSFLHPNALRIKGKLLVTGYEVQGESPEKWRERINQLRTGYGDAFVFVAGVYRDFGMREQYLKTGYVRRDQSEKLKALLRTYLEVCDGIGFNFQTNMMNDLNRNYIGNFVRDIIAPIYSEVMMEPAYKDKLLIWDAMLCYQNFDICHGLDECGTKMLRQSFETALAVNADIIQCNEWNEVNENTHFQPTVARGLSTARIMRHYMEKIRGEKLSPLPGDDPAIPNLCLSYRQFAKLGESLNFEVLNIPDSVKLSGTLKAQLTLNDEKGEVIRELPEQQLAANSLNACVWRVASEEMADHAILNPVLTVTTTEGKKLVYGNGLMSIKLTPTWNKNYIYVRQPLRDLTKPEKVSFELVKGPEGNENIITVKGEYIGKEELAFIDVLEDDFEVYSHDPAGEYLNPEKYARVMITPLFAADGMQMRGVIKVKNVSEYVLKHTSAHKNSMVVNKADGIIEIDNMTWNPTSNERIFIMVPWKDMQNGSLEFSIDQYTGWYAKKYNTLNFTVSLADLDKYGVWAKNFDHLGYWKIEKFNKSPDISFHLNDTSARFQTTLRPHSLCPSYYMRAITKSGREYRTRSFALQLKKDEGMKTVTIYSASKDKLLPVNVKCALLPEIVYNFVDSYGAILPTAEKSWMGTLGCGLGRSGPMTRPKFWPVNTADTAPEWVKADGAEMLRFNGKNQFLWVPQSAVPSGEFAVVFEIKPKDPERSQILMRNHGYYIGSFTLAIRNSKLMLDYCNHNVVIDSFDTGLEIKPDVWQKIEISYDFSNLKVRVNDKQWSTPYSKRPFNQAATILGGHGNGNLNDNMGLRKGDGYFNGLLKSLEFYHYAR